jgi:hypothetical protein
LIGRTTLVATFTLLSPSLQAWEIRLRALRTTASCRVFILEILKEQSADDEGTLRVLDTIMAIGGVAITGKSFTEVMQMLLNAHSPVELDVHRLLLYHQLPPPFPPPLPPSSSSSSSSLSGTSCGQKRKAAAGTSKGPKGHKKYSKQGDQDGVCSQDRDKIK